MIESFAHKEAARLAQKLFAEAVENEPPITVDLQKIASEISVKMVGLENKFKSEESLIRKLVGRANINSETIQEIAEPKRMMFRPKRLGLKINNPVFRLKTLSFACKKRSVELKIQLTFF